MENLKLTNIIRKLATREEFTNEEKRLNEIAIENAKENGYVVNGQYNIELRNLIPSNVYDDQVNNIGLTKKDNDITNILEKTNLVTNCKNRFKFPFVTLDNIEWGIPRNNLTFETNKQLSAHRLAAQFELSTEIVLSANNIEKQLTDLTISAIYQKLVQTMFSSIYNSEECPDGLLNNIQPTEITDTDSLINLQNELDTKSDNAIWIISPKAKKELFKLNKTERIFDDGKLLGNDYIFTNLLEDNKICYIDLKKLIIAQFGVIGISVDSYTKKIHGRNVVTIDSYFDFAIANNEFIKVGEFRNNDSEQNNE